VLQLPDLNYLSDAEKDALIRALWQRLDAAERRIAELEAKLGEPPKTPDNSSVPPSKGQKANQPVKAERQGPRHGSLGRRGGGRPLACDPDETVIAKALACAHCQAALTDAEQVLHGRYDKIDLPVVRPVVTRVERFAGHCRCCGHITLAPVPEGMEEGTPFSVNILALAIYLRFTHAISYQRLTRMFLHLFALRISEGALDAMFRRAKPCFDDEVAVILARLRRSRIVCSDETTVRIDGRTHWNWVFQNDQVVIHVIRNSRAASVVTDVLAMAAYRLDDLAHLLPHLTQTRQPVGEGHRHYRAWPLETLLQDDRRAACAVQRAPSAGTEGTGRDRERGLGTQDAVPAAPRVPRDQSCTRAGCAAQAGPDRADRTMLRRHYRERPGVP
jgi:transposase